MKDKFWLALDELVATSKIIIDRPAGTAHPRYPDFVYPHDYGYLDGTSAPDGNAIDIWLGSLSEKKVVGIIATVDMLKRDSEIKILIGCTHKEMQEILTVHNQSSQSGILLRRTD